MEPEVMGLPMQIAPEISSAISLKRIADFVCGHPEQLDIVQYLSREFGGRGE